MHDAVERQQMLFAQRLERNRSEQDEFGVDSTKRDFQEWSETASGFGSSIVRS
jgi:hypothetical protein